MKRKPRPPSPPLTLESMRQAVATQLGLAVQSIADDEDLVRRGLDSLGIMRISNLCRRSGVEVRFDDLISSPTLSSWWRLASSRSAQAVTTPNADGIDEFAPFDLSPMQQAYWIGGTQMHSLGAVSAHYYVELDGDGVDADRLDRALRAVHVLHPMLRTQFLPDGRQRIMPQAHWRGLTVDDLSGRSAEECERQLQARREALANRRLGFEHGEVFDARLTRLPNCRSRLHINISMLICDARSFQILLGDIARVYDDPDRSPGPPRYGFQRFLRDKSRQSNNARTRAKTYWHERLGGLPGAPQLPLAVAPAELGQQTHARRTYRLSPEARQSLARQARQHGVPLPAVFIVAFAESLALWSAEPRFLLNLPLFDRDAFSPEVAELVGDFTNALLLDVDMSRQLSFVEQARGLHPRLAEAAAHADYPGVELLRDLARAQGGVGIAAPVVFTSTLGLGDLFSSDVRRRFGAPVWISSQTPQVWLDHQVLEWDDGFLLNLDFAKELFAPELIDDLFDAYVAQLERLARSATAWLEPAVCTVPGRQRAVRTAVNATHRPFIPNALHHAFFSRAGRAPDRPALIGVDGTPLSYGALAERALRIGGALAARAVAPGDSVAILLPKGPDQIAAVLGVLAAGATFVPVAVDQPPNRQSEICRSAGVKKIISAADGMAPFDWPCPDVLGVTASAVGLQAPVDIGPEALAYVIYTSGSTGVPKGVEMTHAAALNTIEDINARFNVGSNDRILAVSGLEFDLSIYDIFGLLSVGGALVLIEDDRKRDAGHLVDLCTRWGVTIWNSVPALLEMLVIAAEAHDARLVLRLALVSGDWIGLDLPKRLKACADACRFISLGGATEAAIWSIGFEVDHVEPTWRSIPYGRPLANHTFRVVDQRGRDRPDGVPGELWIGGRGLARGYRADPERTADKFVIQGKTRWYRTGDLGRYRPDGVIEFLGRTDFQIKIRGHRIELGEIEAALSRHPQVSDAIAFAAGPDCQSLACAVVLRSSEIDCVALQAFLADLLPGYMVPRRILVLPRMPLTENGKVDRQALARLAEEEGLSQPAEPPHPGLEEEIAKLWRTLLAHDFSADSSFFAIGGDSLIATRLLDLVHRHFAVRVSLRQFLARPTIRALAAVISRETAQMEEGVI
jgi:yersiniabactin nonribosomal peptide synthetase